MAENTKIEWCDHTFNPWTGCTKVSPACDNCYAEAWAKRSGHVQWGAGKPRRRTNAVTWGETRAMLRALDYPVNGRPISMQQIVGAVFVLALRTGMRAGEITGLEWARVHGRWVTLAETKSGTARDVPLSARAARLIERMRGLHPEMVFPISEHSRDALFRKARDKAGLSGFRFHDARHSAATRIGATVGQPGRLSFPEFVRVFGWKDPKMAMIYCNPSAESLADKL